MQFEASRYNYIISIDLTTFSPRCLQSFSPAEALDPVVGLSMGALRIFSFPVILCPHLVVGGSSSYRPTLDI